jgi:ribosomal protein L40E
MRCSKCGVENPESKRFCGDCGAGLAKRCAKCGAENPPEKKFCGDCGNTLGSAAGSAQDPKRSADADIRLNPAEGFEPTDGERKTITVLFADIKGSMELMKDIDPEEARESVGLAKAQ